LYSEAIDRQDQVLDFEPVVKLLTARAALIDAGADE
jgi:hypothetical protein